MRARAILFRGLPILAFLVLALSVSVPRSWACTIAQVDALTAKGFSPTEINTFVTS